MTRPRRLRNESVQSPLETYLREINETPLLNADEEKQLAYRIEDGDSEARDRMVRANLRLVVNIARSYTGKGLGLQDLIEEGNLGLLRAVEGFDPTMNTRFSTYASYWIKQSIKRPWSTRPRPSASPPTWSSCWPSGGGRRPSSRRSWAGTPTQEEIARSLDLPKKKLNIIKKAIRVYNSAPQTDQADNGWSLDEMLMDGHTKTPDTEMVEADDLHHVLDLLEKMDKREADRPAHALRPGRRGAEDAQGDRRAPRPDPRARPPDRERGAGQAQREHASRVVHYVPTASRDVATGESIRSLSAPTPLYTQLPGSV